MSKAALVVGQQQRLLDDHDRGLAAEVLVDGLPLTTIWPVPFLMNTRATDDLRRPVP
jgi:hypothetical protein